MWRMWKASALLLLLLLLACGDSAKQPDASGPIDSPTPDAFQCRFTADCSSAAPLCCYNCSPGGACEPSPSCQASTSSFCSQALCDPMASAPCTKPTTGEPGTCMQVELSMFDHRMVWACK